MNLNDFTRRVVLRLSSFLENSIITLDDLSESQLDSLKM